MTRLDSSLKKTRVKQPPHLVVGARAGTGKTTTLIEGLRIIKGEAPNIDPSPQQASIWAKMRLSHNDPSVCFVAFNKSIATELQQRVPEGCSAMTMHSMGFKAIRGQFDGIKVNSYRVQDIISELLNKDIRDLRRDNPEALRATERLVGLCKMNLIGLKRLGDAPGFEEQDTKLWMQWLEDLVSHYDIELNGQQAEIFGLVPRVLEHCKDVARDGCIDFNDMIWLPIVLDLDVFQYDLLLVDEAQDLNRCQQALAMKAGKRLILCGDDKQAIYGWAGADSNSIHNMMRQLSLTDSGCEYLPLTVTRRCGKAIVREAQKIVKDFEAHKNNCEGKVSRASFKSTKKIVGEPLNENGVGYGQLVQDGNMILCRCNAPLVSECFKFLKNGRKANIQGRDVGQGLISTIRKLMKNFKLPLNPQALRDNALVAAGLEPEGDDDTPPEYSPGVVELVGHLSVWLHHETQKENAKRNPSDSRLIAMQDKHDCILCFTEDQTTVDGVVAKIESIFTDDKNGDGIKLSSVHKAKGLEAKRVFILLPEGAEMPHSMAKSEWQIEQEWNCLYIAITRAKEELVYVR